MDLQMFTSTVHDLFGIPGTEDVEMDVFESTPLSPRTSQSYKFRKEHLYLVCAYLASGATGDGLLVHGPMGSGKTSLLLEVLGRLNWPTLAFSWNESSDVADLIGRDRIAFGDTAYQYGPLAMAMKEGYALIINEVDRGRGGNLVGLNDVLDGGVLVIKDTGEVIQPHPNFRLFATANSSGMGDRTGAYTGSVRKLDPAFLDRFWYMKLDYMSADEEIDLFLRKYPEFPGIFITKMAEFARETRQKCDDAAEILSVAFSTRAFDRFLGIARLLGITSPASSDDLIPALKPAYLDRLQPDEREVALTTLRMCVN